MKKILSLTLAVMLLVSVIPTAFAAETQDYSLGTAVVYTANGETNENWTVTVPAKLAPGTGGTVTLEGYWPSNKTITVTAQENVVLTNSINANDTKTLAVDFKNGISAAGSNTEKQKFTETVSVAAITNALFGTWDGLFYYNVNSTSTTTQEAPKFQMIHRPTNTTTNSAQTFKISGFELIPEDITTEYPEYGWTTTKLNANNYYASIANLSTPLKGVVEEDMYALDYGENNATGLDIKFLNVKASELCEYTSICVWPENHPIQRTETRFEMQDYTINGEVISVPTITYTHHYPDGTSSSGTPQTIWTYDEATKTFTMGTPDTVIVENMVIYVDILEMLLNAATENWSQN